MFGLAEGLNGIAVRGLYAQWRYLYANDWFSFAEVVNAYLRKIVLRVVDTRAETSPLQFLLLSNHTALCAYISYN